MEHAHDHQQALLVYQTVNLSAQREKRKNAQLKNITTPLHRCIFDILDNEQTASAIDDFKRILTHENSNIRDGLDEVTPLGRILAFFNAYIPEKDSQSHATTMCELLLEHGADPNMVTHQKGAYMRYLPLHFSHVPLHITHMLLKHKADPNGIADPDIQTPLTKTLKEYRHNEFHDSVRLLSTPRLKTHFKLLLSQGADPNQRNCDALNYALTNLCYPYIWVQKLLKYGACIDEELKAVATQSHTARCTINKTKTVSLIHVHALAMMLAHPSTNSYFRHIPNDITYQVMSYILENNLTGDERALYIQIKSNVTIPGASYATACAAHTHALPSA